MSLQNSPVLWAIGGCCIYPAIVFAAGVLFERYRRRFRIIRVEPDEGREV